MMGALHAQQGDIEKTMMAVFNSHSDQLMAQVAGNVEFQRSMADVLRSNND